MQVKKVDKFTSRIVLPATRNINIVSREVRRILRGQPRRSTRNFFRSTATLRRYASGRHHLRGHAVGLNYLIGYATCRIKRLEALIEGRPQLPICNGKLYRDVMEQQRLTQHELDAALRREGDADIAHVHIAMIENSGEITVQLNSESAIS